MVGVDMWMPFITVHRRAFPVLLPVHRSRPIFTVVTRRRKLLKSGRWSLLAVPHWTTDDDASPAEFP
jgi:hypothetical protein